MGEAARYANPAWVSALIAAGADPNGGALVPLAAAFDPYTPPESVLARDLFVEHDRDNRAGQVVYDLLLVRGCAVDGLWVGGEGERGISWFDPNILSSCAMAWAGTGARWCHFGGDRRDPAPRCCKGRLATSRGTMDERVQGGWGVEHDSRVDRYIQGGGDSACVYQRGRVMQGMQFASISPPRRPWDGQILIMNDAFSFSRDYLADSEGR